jgi:hypothetical protein
VGIGLSREKSGIFEIVGITSLGGSEPDEIMTVTASSKDSVITMTDATLDETHKRSSIIHILALGISRDPEPA